MNIDHTTKKKQNLNSGIYRLKQSSSYIINQSRSENENARFFIYFFSGVREKYIF